jgi:hypothetical protein
MVALVIDDAHLELKLSFWESLGAFTWCCCVCPPLWVPYNKITNIRVCGNLWAEKSGLRVGTGIPDVINLGSWWYGAGQDFCAIYNRNPGIVVDLSPGYSRYRRWVFSIENAEELVEEIHRRVS